MAAVLCDCMRGVCQIITFVVTCPFRACGDSCEGLGRTLTSPFVPYIVTTLGLNVPPIVWGIRAGVSILNSNGVRCHLDRWLWVNAALCILHIWGAFYIVSRVQDEKQTKSTATTTSKTSAAAEELLQPQHSKSAIADVDDELWDGVVIAPTTSYRNIKFEPGTSLCPKKQQQQRSTKPTTLADKILYTMSSSGASIPAIATSETWKERASREVEFGDGTEDGEANSLQRLKQVFCYDSIVATYIVSSLFWCIWQSYGISQILLTVGRENNNNNEANSVYAAQVCDSIEYWTVLTIMCSFLYMMLVCVAFSCSLLCMRY